jgi:2-methylcitrate dehydratase PrpD
MGREREMRLRMRAEKDGWSLTRRGLLQSAGCALAASAFPFARLFGADAGTGPAISPMMVKLSTYIAAAGGRALPDDVVEKAKHHILDTISAMVSGSQLPPGKAALTFAKASPGDKVATVAGSTFLCGAIDAAMANGVLAHSDETDDSHSPSLSHPGCSIVPATLATGEHFGIDGMKMIRAVTLGYDIGPRFTMTLGAREYMDNTHRSTHTISGNFGSTAAAACAAGLTVQQVRWALDYAAEQCSGLGAWQRDTQHIQKAFVFAGMPARNGVTAALLVQSGWTAVDDIFSGEDNFFQAFNPKADPNGLVEKLGERYEIARTNIKKWTVGSPIQAPLDALQSLMEQHKFKADQVQKVAVRVATSEAAVVNNREIPDICLQHMLAVMLLDGTASFASAHDAARMKNPDIVRERAKVQLIPDAEFEKLLPARVAVVDVTLTGGMHFSQRVDAVRGSAENPMPRKEVADKARDLMTPVLGAANCNALIDRIWTLDTVKNVRELRPLLQRT